MEVVFYNIYFTIFMSDIACFVHGLVVEVSCINYEDINSTLVNMMDLIVSYTI